MNSFISRNPSVLMAMADSKKNFTVDHNRKDGILSHKNGGGSQERSSLERMGTTNISSGRKATVAVRNTTS